MIETGAYGERMAGYLHLAEPPVYAALGSGRSELAVTRLHAPNAMIITPHNEDLAKFNRDGSTGQIYISHLPGHSERYLIIPFKDWPTQ